MNVIADATLSGRGDARTVGNGRRIRIADVEGRLSNL